MMMVQLIDDGAVDDDDHTTTTTTITSNSNNMEQEKQPENHITASTVYLEYRILTAVLILMLKLKSIYKRKQK